MKKTRGRKNYGKKKRRKKNLCLKQIPGPPVKLSTIKAREESEGFLPKPKWPLSALEEGVGVLES